MKVSRRKLVVTRVNFGIAGLVGLPGGLTKEPVEGSDDKTSKGDEVEHGEEVSPVEDLMREHGAMERILLIYAESLRRLRSNQDLPPKVLANTAAIVRSFVEDYHEKLEEDYLFPRFKKANKLVDLVDILMQQHQAGRRLTDTVLRFSNTQGFKSDNDRRMLADTLWLSIRIYDPHAAREDTVLFPTFRSLANTHEYHTLGEEFEEKEHQLFGDHSFGKTVDRIASIKKSLGIYDLSQFTPRK